MNSLDRPLFVEDVITAITGGIGGIPARSLRSSMERAAVEFDERTAEAFARALFSELSQNPQDLVGLESLIILGLAHPNILTRHGISLETEGRRLAFVLDRGGQAERAKQLLEMLSTNLPQAQAQTETKLPTQESPKLAERLATIDGLLREADKCISWGRRRQALQLLHQVLKLDRDRFDVARMIRDLQRQADHNRARRATAAKVALSLILVGVLGYGLVRREQSVRERWDAIPSAESGDLAALHGRLDAIEALVNQEHFWGGVFQAWRERDQLRARITRIEEENARTARTAALQKQERQQTAEDVRLRGMLSVKSGRFEEALVDLRQALELGGEHWEQRQRVLTDISAIESWKAKKP